MLSFALLKHGKGNPTLIPVSICSWYSFSLNFLLADKEVNKKPGLTFFYIMVIILDRMHPNFDLIVF